MPSALPRPWKRESSYHEPSAGVRRLVVVVVGRFIARSCAPGEETFEEASYCPPRVGVVRGPLVVGRFPPYGDVPHRPFLRTRRGAARSSEKPRIPTGIAESRATSHDPDDLALEDDAELEDIGDTGAAQVGRVAPRLDLAKRVGKRGV